MNRLSRAHGFFHGAIGEAADEPTVGLVGCARPKGAGRSEYAPDERPARDLTGAGQRDPPQWNPLEVRFREMPLPQARADHRFLAELRTHSCQSSIRSAQVPGRCLDEEGELFVGDRCPRRLHLYFHDSGSQ